MLSSLIIPVNDAARLVAADDMRRMLTFTIRSRRFFGSGALLPKLLKCPASAFSTVYVFLCAHQISAALAIHLIFPLDLSATTNLRKAVKTTGCCQTQARFQ